MGIDVWCFTFNGIPGRKMPDCADTAAVQRAFDFNLAHLAGLEPLGFTGVFFSEHHFINSISPAPNLLVAALAQRTRTLRLGVLGNVLPFHQPWRLAEELGMLDYLSHGRLEIGLVSGISTELAFANIPAGEQRPMFEEALAFLDRALGERVVTHEGRHWRIHGMPVLPRLRPEPRRRTWISAYSEGTARLAARHRCRVATAFQSVAAAKRTFDFYRDEAARTGFAVAPEDIALRRQVLLAESDAVAAALHGEVQAAGRARINDMVAQIEARRAAGGMMPAKTNLLEGLLDPDSEYLFGSPRTVAGTIVEQCRRTGAGHFIAYHPPALEEDEIRRHYELWRDVIPLLGRVDIAA